MALDIAANREKLISNFSALETDPYFKITSSCNCIYNCIAFAMFTDSCWVCPEEDVTSCPNCWWPEGVNGGNAESDLIDAFKAVGFVESDNGNYEEGYDKVALYGIDGEWRHATRILDDNIEQGKFGRSWDAQHGRKAVSGVVYGYVYAYMKRPIKNRHLTKDAIVEVAPIINIPSIEVHL